MPNTVNILIIDEGVDTRLSDSARVLSKSFGKYYNLLLLSEIGRYDLYQEMHHDEIIKRFLRKHKPEIVLYELLGDYLANRFNAKENGRKACLISKGESYDEACKSLYGDDMMFVSLNGKPEKTKKDLDLLFE